MENKTIIEMEAINRLQHSLLRTEMIQPRIQDNDKTPSWDGEIILYNKPQKINFCKDSVIGRISVQVKGTWVEHFQKNKTYFQADIRDLQNYSIDGGVIFFLVQIKDFDNYKIYYASLLPFDLRRLLDQAKKQKTKQIKLDLFPHKDKNEILQILLQFLENKKKQANLWPSVRCITDLKNSEIEIENFEFCVIGIGTQKEVDLFHHLLNRPQYLYAKPKNIEVPFAVDKIYLEKIIASQDTPVEVNGELLYDRIDLIYQSNQNTQIKLGNNVTIEIKDSSLTINYITGTLKEQICAMKLFCALFQKQKIKIGEFIFPTDCEFASQTHTFDQVKGKLSELLLVDTTLKKLHIKKDLKFDNLSEQDLRNLSYLVHGISNKKPVPFNCPKPLSYGLLTIGNIHVFLMLKQNPNGAGCFIQDFFTLENLLYVPNGMPKQSGSKISPYVLLSFEEFKQTDNANLSDMISSIHHVPYSDLYGEMIMSLILELLKWFDEEKNETILEVVIQILNFLQKNHYSHEEIYEINRLQAEKRRRSLKKDEIRYLMSMKQPNVSLQYQLAANILLESFQEAQIIYEMLDNKEQKIFDTYPIKNLWIK